MEILALLGLIAVLFVGMKWGPLVFTPLLNFLSQVLELLSQIPRTIFVVLFVFILLKLEVIPFNAIAIFPVVTWEFLTNAVLAITLTVSVIWDIRTAKFPRIKINIFKKVPKSISD